MREREEKEIDWKKESRARETKELTWPGFSAGALLLLFTIVMFVTLLLDLSCGATSPMTTEPWSAVPLWPVMQLNHQLIIDASESKKNNSWVLAIARIRIITDTIRSSTNVNPKYFCSLGGGGGGAGAGDGVGGPGTLIQRARV